MSINSKMTAIADAIRNLLDISGTMGLDAMADNISSITKRGAVAGTISEKSEQYIIPSGYHNGSGTVEISPDEQSKIIAENIKNGVTILGVAGSASGEIYSIIAVTYPEGSVCTCSNGTKTLKARDTSGKALFNVPSVGTWTVTCTDGTNTKTVSVEITTEGQIVSVTLSYQLLLYEAGNEYADVTGGWGQTTSGTFFGAPLTGTVTFNSDHIYLYNPDERKIPLVNTKNKIKFDGYSKLFATFNSSSFTDDRPCVMCVLSDVGGVAIENLRIGLVNFLSGAGTVELDVSGITEGYVAFYGTDSKGTTAKITKVWLE